MSRVSFFYSIAVFFLTLFSLSPAQAHEIRFLSNNMDLPEGVVVTTEIVSPSPDFPVVPIIQELDFGGEGMSLRDAYLELNGEVISGYYSFRINRLIFPFFTANGLEDGLHIGEIAVQNREGTWFYRPIAFEFDLSPAVVSQEVNSDGNFDVSVLDPEGFDRVIIQGKGIKKRRIKIPDSTSALDLEVIRKKAKGRISSVKVRQNAVSFDKEVFEILDHLENLIEIPSEEFVLIQDEILQGGDPGTLLQNRRQRGKAPLCCDRPTLVTAVKDFSSLESIFFGSLTQSESTQGQIIEAGLSPQETGQMKETLEGIEQVGRNQNCNPQQKQNIQNAIQQFTARLAQLEAEKKEREKEAKDTRSKGDREIEKAKKKAKDAKKARDKAQRKATKDQKSLDKTRDACQKFFSSLPGASPSPTGQFIGSPTNMSNPLGGRVHITDGNQFADSLQSFSRELDKCRDKTKRKADRAEESQKKADEKQNEYDEALKELRELIQRKNAENASAQAALEKVCQDINAVGTALPALNAALKECCDKIEEQIRREKERQEALRRLEAKRKKEEAARLAREQAEAREAKRQEQIRLQNERAAQRAAAAAERKKAADDARAERLKKKAAEVEAMDPLAISETKLKFAAQQVFRHLYYGKLDCSCEAKALAAANNTNSVVTDILGSLAVDVIFAGADAFPGLGTSSKLALAATKALAQHIWGNKSLPTELAKNLLSVMGAEIFNNLLNGGELTEQAAQQLASGGLASLLESEGVTMSQWEGETELRKREWGKVKVKTTMLYNPKTRWVVLFVKVDNCPMVVVKYKMNEDGSTPNLDTARVQTVR